MSIDSLKYIYIYIKKKKGALKNSQYSQGNTCDEVSFNKVADQICSKLTINTPVYF